MNLANSVTPTSIVVNAKLYNSTKDATLKVNGSDTQSLAAYFANYTYNITDEITYLQLETSKYAWISSITVNYTSAASFTLTATSNNDAYGTVSVSGSTITATPAEGYRVSTTTPYEVTSGDAEVTQNGNTFSVDADADCTVQINFEAIPSYAVTINDPTGGTLVVKDGETTLSSGDEVAEGTVLTITATPDEDYNFTNWTAEDATLHTYTATFTYTVNSAVTISATFTAKVYHDAIFSVDGVTTTVRTEEGKPISFPENPSNKGGKTFVGWVTEAIDGVTDTAPESYVTSADMEDADVTFYAVFADVTLGNQTEKEDVLDRALTGVTGTSYTAWSGEGTESDAVYKGNSAGGNESIQLNNGSPKGIVTTTSGGIAKKISVVWNSSTNSGRTIDIYGSNTAYSATTDLYDDSAKGTKLATIVKGTSTEFDITGNYEYIGICSASGALYLTSITITWATGTPDTYSGFCTTLPADDRTAVNMTSFTAAQTTLMMGVTESTTTTVTNDQPGWTAAYTYTSDNTEVATVDASGEITAVGRGTANITATLNVDKDDPAYKVGDTFTKSVEITVVNPSHTVIFYANGVKLSETSVQETDPIEVPEATAYAGFVFIGWTEAIIDGSQADMPELATVSIMGTADVTYYAVYAECDKADASLTITTDTEGIPTSYGTANTFTEYTFEGVKFKVQQMYLNSGKLQWRASGNSSGTGTMYNTEALPNLQSIVLTYSGDDNKNFTLNVGTTENPTSGTSITPTSIGNANVYTYDCSGGSYSYFVLANGSGAGYLASIEINYQSLTINAYCTTLTKSATVTSAGYATYCSESNLNFTGSGIKAYVGTRSGDKLTFTPITQVPANTGLLLVCEGGTTADVPVLASAPAVADNCLVGVTAATTLTSDDYILNVIDGNAGFYKAGSHTTLAKNRAYIPASEGNGVKSFVIDFDGDADAIRAIEGSELNTEANTIYDLSGRRVKKAQKGVYIINGKKVLK